MGMEGPHLGRDSGRSCIHIAPLLRLLDNTPHHTKPQPSRHLRHNGQRQRALCAVQQVSKLCHQLRPGGQLSRQESYKLGRGKQCVTQAGLALLRKACTQQGSQEEET